MNTKFNKKKEVIIMLNSLSAALNSLVIRAQLFMMNVSNPSLALANATGTDELNNKMGQVMNQVVDIFSTIGTWVGVVLIIFGCYQLIMAFRRDSDPEGFIGAAKNIAIGAILAFLLKPILSGLVGVLI